MPLEMDEKKKTLPYRGIKNDFSDTIWLETKPWSYAIPPEKAWRLGSHSVSWEDSSLDPRTQAGGLRAAAF